MTTSTSISSRQHPIVRRCRALARAAHDGCVLLDGEHLLVEALMSDVPVDVVLIARGTHEALAERTAGAGIDTHLVPAAVLAAASPVRRPSGVVAIARWAPAGVAAALADTPAEGPVVGLVSVQDPGNVGSAIRSADALGARAVLALGETADPASWKALRGAMGSTFHLPVGRDTVSAALDAARAAGLTIVAAAPRAADAVGPDAIPASSLILVGSEGAGLPDQVLREADLRVAIPMRPGVESLNVAVTTALLLAAARRQASAAGVAR